MESCGNFVLHKSKPFCLFAASVFYTLKAIEGSTIYLPCDFPSSTQVKANALWSKEIVAGTKTPLNLGDDSTGDNQRMEHLYPLDHDQTLIIRDIVMEDAGIYWCDAPEGYELSTVQVIVDGRSGTL